MTPDCRFLLLTPPGRGAIAALRVEGPDTAHLVERLLRSPRGKPLGLGDCTRPRLARFGSEPAEPIVAHAPSATCIELFCHGGLAAVARIQQLLTEAGCPSIDWRDSLDNESLTAEAELALTEARTFRTAAILLDQRQGALRAALEQIAQMLDAAQAEPALAAIGRLRALAPLGLHLTRPFRVAIFGPPNVGKSSLLNALVGYDRALVHATPGTTRDLVVAQTAFDGWPLELIDTAGLRTTDDAIEQAGIALAEAEIAAADLALAVFDASRPETEAALDDLPAHALRVGNKCDLLDQPAASARRLVSARNGANLGSLLASIVARLVPDPPAPGAAVPFTARQVAMLDICAERIGAGRLAEARRTLVF